MDSKIIDGKIISSAIKEEVKKEVLILGKEKNITPGLAFILIGENPASKIYVRNKGKACEELNIYSETIVMDESVDEKKVLEKIALLNNDEKIHGILVQLPLPSHINEHRVINAIDFRKDVDGFNYVNTGRLMTGAKGFIPCTPYGIIELLKRSNIETVSKNTVIIGRSNIVGKPVAVLLMRKEFSATVTVCHSFTKDIKEHTLNADIIIAAIGKPKFLKSDMIKENSVLIDVGINRIEDANSKSGYRITGDIDFEDCYEKCSRITPVPGGVGLMTTAMLMKNTLESAKGTVFSID